MRPMRTDDVPELVALINRCYRHDGIAMAVQEAELAEELTGYGDDPGSDGRVVVRVGRIIGYARTMLLPADSGVVRCYVFGDVDPGHRGRGIGTDLLRWSTQRARERLLALSTDLPQVVRADAPDTQADRDRLIRAAGYRPVRRFAEMLRSLDPLPALREVPGIALRSWPGPERDDETRTVRSLAFADHWGSAPPTEQAWDREVRGFGSRPDLSVVAVDQRNGAIVGCCLAHRYEADDRCTGRRAGVIAMLGVLPQYRGRGIGAALVVQSLHRFADAGLSHAQLEVDSASPTGADRLYRGLGFARERGTVVYQIDVP